MIIYKATNIINGKIYVGQTIYSLEHRRKQHEYAARSEHPEMVFARAIAKYGPENFTWEVIDTAKTIEELNEKEIYWIEKLGSLVDFDHGYNCNKGGKNGKHSEYTKKAIGDAQRGELSYSWGKKGKLNAMSKPVICLNTGEVYESAMLCAEATGCNHSKISAVCRGDRGSHHNLTFRYLDDDGNIIEPELKVKTTREDKEIYNVDTMEHFPSFVAAERSIGNQDLSNLSRKLKEDGICWHQGFRWCIGKENIEAAKKLNKPSRSNCKTILDKTNNIVYNSIRSVGDGYSTLARKLRAGNGKCTWRDREWEYLE